MLNHLRIENYAIIDELEINFQKNMNVITGETGAGKSILIESVGLILGNRADTSVLKDKQKKCIVEASFWANVKNLKSINGFLADNDFDEIDSELIIRREINANGKSRCFINDTPATVQQLKTVTHWLVDLNQQFDTLELGSDKTQKHIVDSMAGNHNLIDDYVKHYVLFKQTVKKLDQLKSSVTEQKNQQDYLQFLFSELENANFKENEIEELDDQIKILDNANDIGQVIGDINNLLADSDTAVIQNIKSLAQKLAANTKGMPSFNDIVNRLLAVQIELKDILDELESEGEKVNIDPAKLAEMTDRLSLGFTLLKKHTLKTTEQLLQFKNELSNKLLGINNTDEQIIALETEVQILENKCIEIAQKISAARLKVIPDFTKQVNNLLKKVGMPNAQLIVECTQNKNLLSDGYDVIEFMFDANNNKPEPLNKIASGGELSRLMLIIKSLVAEKTQLPTLIFDEIDTGISGEAAKQVGVIMKELSKNLQLMAITHQPQIAAKADVHFYIYKKQNGTDVTTQFKILTPDERIEAIARMMSGDKPTAAALENARELVN